MLHEIWSGGNGAVHQALIGLAQRQCLLRLCGAPSIDVHTSNRTYQRLLATHGVRAKLLPLFGSIPVAVPGEQDTLQRLQHAGADGIVEQRDRWWVLVFFGTLHPVWPPEPLLQRLQAAATAAGKRVALVSIGHLGSGEDLWSRMTATYASRVCMVQLGARPPAAVSLMLQAADFGVATSPYSLLGKSATVAAMLEHGLPVIVNREDGPRIVGDALDPDDEALLVRLDAAFSRRLQEVRRRVPRRRVADVAERLIADLAA
jgi:glycosyltransferase involved in cell wall biosynthesis